MLPTALVASHAASACPQLPGTAAACGAPMPASLPPLLRDGGREPRAVGINRLDHVSAEACTPGAAAAQSATAVGAAAATAAAPMNEGAFSIACTRPVCAAASVGGLNAVPSWCPSFMQVGPAPHLRLWLPRYLCCQTMLTITHVACMLTLPVDCWTAPIRGRCLVKSSPSQVPALHKLQRR